MAGVEVGQAELDTVGPVGDGGPQGLPIPCGGKEFGLSTNSVFSGNWKIVMRSSVWLSKVVW